MKFKNNVKYSKLKHSLIINIMHIKVMLKNLKRYTMYMSELALWRRITAGILLLVPWVFYMVYPAYNMAKPELGGVPFFYWFQTLWLVITAVLSLIGVLLLYPSKR